MMARVGTKLLLGLNVLICVFLFRITAFSSSTGLIRNHLFDYGISILAGIIFICCLVLFWKKSSSILLPAFVLIVLSLVSLTSLSCSSRCIPLDYYDQKILLLAQDAIEMYFNAHSTYPNSLQEIDQKYLGSNPPSIEYTRTGNTYRACIRKEIQYFYGLKINSGKPYCIGPKNPV